MNVRPLSFFGLVPAILFLTVAAALPQSEPAPPAAPQPAAKIVAPARRRAFSRRGIAAGVMPYLSGLVLPEEDSVPLGRKNDAAPVTARPRRLAIGVVRLPHIS